MSKIGSTISPRPRIVRPGDPILADDAGRVRDALRGLQNIRFRIATARRRSWAESMLHEITEVQADYLVCRRIWRAGALGTMDVFVAKPKLLRGSVTARDGVTYVYSGPDAQQRTASKSGEADEVQKVTTPYLVGDVLEVQVVRGVTNIPEVDGQRGRPIDQNVDGRAWAVDPEATP